MPTNLSDEISTTISASAVLKGLRKSKYTIWALFGVVIALFSLYAIVTDGFELFFTRLYDGLTNGFIYSAMAIALVLIYKATGVINFAQGSMAMLGTFVAYVLIVEQGVPTLLGILIAMALSALFGAGIERVLIRPFDPTNHLPITIITLGLFLGINAFAGLIWLYDPRAFPTPFPSGADDYFELFGARLRYDRLGIWIMVGLMFVLLTLLLRKTKAGLAFRSVSSSIESSRLVGINVGRTLQFGWALAAAVGTLAGCLIANTTLLEPNFMNRVLIFSFAAATLGGLDSIGGAVVGGLIVALVETMAGGYIDVIGSELAATTALAVIVVVLVVRPNGLYGSKRIERV